MVNKIWPFLKAEENQKLLGWIGGGLAVLAGGLWAVFVHFYPSPEGKFGSPQKQIEADCGSVAIGGDVSGATITAGSGGGCPKPRPAGPVPPMEDRPPVHAQEGSIAIGGNVSNSTITIGVPPEKLEELVRLRAKDFSDLSESQKETIAGLKEKLDLNQRQVTSALEILGEANVPPERLAAKLVEIAERYKTLQTAAAAQPGDDSKVAALKAEAQKAIQDGQLGKADEILAAIEKIQTEALDRLMLNAAQVRKGDALYAVETAEGYLLTPYDPAIAEEITLGERFMKQYRDTFKALAK